MRFLRAAGLGAGCLLYTVLGMGTVLGIAMIGSLLIAVAAISPGPLKPVVALLGGLVIWFAFGTVRVVWLPWHPNDYRYRDRIIGRWRRRRQGLRRLRGGDLRLGVWWQALTGVVSTQRAKPQNARPTLGSSPLRTFPLCPKCASAMVIRTARTGANTGHRFWGCSRYPRCTETRAYSE